MSTIRVISKMILFLFIVGMFWLFLQLLPTSEPAPLCDDGTYNCYEYSGEF